MRPDYSSSVLSLHIVCGLPEGPTADPVGKAVAMENVSTEMQHFFEACEILMEENVSTGLFGQRV